MPLAGASPRPPSPTAALRFPPAAWRRLVRLPAEVMVAAVTLLAQDERERVTCGLAGLDAIAAGRGSDSDLVRAVVAAIYAEPEDDDTGDPAGAPADPAGGRDRLLAGCREAARALRAHADPGDAAVYRFWLQQVTARVVGAQVDPCRCAEPPRQPGPGGAGRELLTDLGSALR